MSTNKFIKIVIMEDNELYNTFFTRKLQLYTDSLACDTGFVFEIISYINLSDCIKNLTEDIDIIFLDYYLMKNITASDLFKKIREICTKCKIYVVSRIIDENIINKALADGADEFIFKDKMAFMKSCNLVKRFMFNKWQFI
jgi:DNA-binding NarL/FixJ family response regulator